MAFMRMHTRGLTLLEMLTTLLVVVTLTFAGIPALSSFVADARRTARVHALIGGIHLARQAAIAAFFAVQPAGNIAPRHAARPHAQGIAVGGGNSVMPFNFPGEGAPLSPCFRFCKDHFWLLRNFRDEFRL